MPPVTMNDKEAARTFANWKRSRFTRITGVLIVLYAQFALMLPATFLAEVMRCVQITFASVVVMGYWRAGTRCFYVVGRWPQKQSVVALGILLSWLSISVSGSWGLLWRLSGQPSWMINNDFFTSWTAASSFAASLHMIAPHMIGENIPEMDRRRYQAAGLIGLFLLIFVGFWRPDLSMAAEFARPYMQEPDWMRDGLLRVWRSSGALFDYLRAFS